MPSRKPTQRKLVEGDCAKIGRHKLEEQLDAEPKAEPGLPQTSPRLKGDAALIYIHFVEQLQVMDLDRAPDAFTLERCASMMALCWKCERKLAHDSHVRRVPVMRGDVKVGYREVKSKWHAVLIDAQKEFRCLAAPFGLTGPASRAALTADVPARDVRNDAELWNLLSKARHDDDPLPQ